MLRPSTLTAFGAPSRTSLRSATFTKLDFGFDISHFPSLFKHVHSSPAFRKTQGGVGGGSAVLIRADIGSVSSKTDEELVSGGMSAAEGGIRSATERPLFKYRSESGQDLCVGVVPEHDSPHLMEQPIPRESGV